MRESTSRRTRTSKVNSEGGVLLISMVVLFIGGCAGISHHDPGERKADAEKGRIHSMNREVIPKLVGSWKLISFHSQDSSGQKAYPLERMPGEGSSMNRMGVWPYNS